MTSELYNRSIFNMYNRQQMMLAENQILLKDFIGLPFDEDSIKEQILVKQNNYSNQNRTILQNTIRNNYTGIELNELVNQNINLLGNENTFTITCGHQLTLFGGPAYFFYKIIHVISLCKKLNQKFDQYQFVPIFWMASEDHDKEEISNLNIFKSTINWETDSEGPTGNYKLEQNFERIKSEFIHLFSNSEFDEIKDHLINFSGVNLSQGFVRFVNSIFEKYGLIIIEPNSKELKKLFIPIIKQELEYFETFENVTKSNSQLEEFGFLPQAKIQNINLFYLKENQRIRIKFENNQYVIGGTYWNRDQIMKEVEENPELFSPNVFLRPIYQELILPNLAFIGGPSELNYWLQLKNLFHIFNIPYPLIQQRLSLVFIEKSLNNKLKKINFEIPEYFNNDLQSLKKRYMEQTDDIENIDWKLIESNFEKTKNSCLDVYQKNAPEITKAFEAEWNGIEKSLSKIKYKLEKRIMERHEQEINSLQQIKTKLFPSNIPQERFFHFFHFCPHGNLGLIDEIIETYDPFDNRVLVIYED